MVVGAYDRRVDVRVAVDLSGAEEADVDPTRADPVVEHLGHRDDLGGGLGEVAFVECPFTGERLSAVRAVNPDVTVIHAQQADREGNVMLWGLSGVQKEAVLAADRAIVTVEEIVDALEPRPHAVVLPSWVLTAVSHVPGGAWPSYAHDYSRRDNRFYAAWDEIARDRDRFRAWMDEQVMSPSGDVARVGGEG